MSHKTKHETRVKFTSPLFPHTSLSKFRKREGQQQEPLPRSSELLTPLSKNENTGGKGGGRGEPPPTLSHLEDECMIKLRRRSRLRCDTLFPPSYRVYKSCCPFAPSRRLPHFPKLVPAKSLTLCFSPIFRAVAVRETEKLDFATVVRSGERQAILQIGKATPRANWESSSPFWSVHGKSQILRIVHVRRLKLCRNNIFPTISSSNVDI